MNSSFDIPSIMSEYGLSHEQASAMDISRNTAMRAGAGSGKTRVLTSRFIRVLLEKDDAAFSNNVAITFTRKAAAEMKSRIRSRLAEKLSGSTPATPEFIKLNRLMKMVSTANIDTIHGFCGKLVRDNYLALRLDPGFQVMEEADAAAAMAAHVDAALNGWLDETSNQAWLDSICQVYQLKNILSGKLAALIIRIYELARTDGLEPEMIRIDSAASSDDPSAALAAVVISVMRSAHTGYADYKARQNVLDFNDLELYTYRMLQDDAIRERYFAEYKYFFIDEFQDVNPLQKKIIDLLTRQSGRIPDGRLFIVGDRKQSIYGFRGSDPQVFASAMSEIDANGYIADLKTCYRSSVRIVSYVNDFFSQLMVADYEPLLAADGKPSGEPAYLYKWNKDNCVKENTTWDDSKKLLTDNNTQEKFRKILYTDKQNGPSFNEASFRAGVLANAIGDLVRDGYQFRDIAILIRTRGKLTSIETVLEDRKIPYTIVGGLGFWQSREVREMLDIISYLYNPADWISYISVLRSLVFAIPDESLVWLTLLREKHPGVSYIDLLEILASQDTCNNRDQLRKTREILSLLASYARIHSYLHVYREALRLTHMKSIVLSLPQGEKRFRNLEKLENIIENNQKKGFFSYSSMSAYLVRLSEEYDRETEAFLDADDSDAVRIMTIHGAKGLEFPAVIVPDLDSPPRRTSSEGIAYHSGVIYCQGAGESDGYSRIIAEQADREQQEAHRLLYVAATRAEKRLVFTGAYGGRNISGQKSFLDSLSSIDVDRQNMYEEEASSLPEYINEENGKVINFAAPTLPSPHLIASITGDPAGLVSISMWMKYRDCPRGYYYRYIAGLRNLEQISTLAADKEGLEDTEEEKYIPGNEAAIRLGLGMHSLLERADIPSVIAEDPETLYRKYIMKNSDAGDSLLDRFLQCINGFQQIEKSHPAKIPDQLLRELDFRVPLTTKVALTGIIDRADVYGNSEPVLKLIDYKTNFVPDAQHISEKAAYYSAQLQVYAWAMEQLSIFSGTTGIVTEASLYFLQPGTACPVDVTAAAKSAAVNKLRETIPWLLGRKGMDEYSCGVSEMCEYCGYNNICK